ncbi:MAG: PAS domain S-box protein [Myxococcales bacterium]|nr:PAS domain S-box protein [Myxococcales bacterium]
MSNSIRQALETDDDNLALLKVLADNSFDSILVTDATKAGKIIYVNKAFTKLTGYGQDEVIGQTPRILQGTGTDRKVIKELATALSAGRKFEGKAINFKKDGSPFIMHWRVLPVKVGGKIRAWVAIQRETSGL